MLKTKMVFFSCAIAMTPSLPAMWTNGTLVSYDQPVAIQSHLKSFSGTSTIPFATHNPKQEKSAMRKNKQYSYDLSDTAVVLQAAEQELRERNQLAEKISAELNENYVRVGEYRCLLRQMWVSMNNHRASYGESSQNIVAELNQLSDGVSCDRSVINRVREINNRFDGLLDGLIRIKIRNYQIDWCDYYANNCCLRRWEIDSFFNERIPHDELSPSLREYVQAEVENEYKNRFQLSHDCDVREHALRKSANSVMDSMGAIAYLKELLKTKTFKRLPKTTKLAVRKDICAKLEHLCAHTEITYKEGKICDGDELEQECGEQ